MKRRTSGLFFMGLAVVAGLLAALFTVRYLEERQATAWVLVASGEIQPFTELTAQHFVAQELPVDALVGDEVADLEALVGRFNRSLLLSGTVVRAGHLVDAGAASLTTRLSEAREPDKRAFALPIDAATGVGGSLEPGDRVDVIASVRMAADPEEPPLALAKIIARNIEVLELIQPNEAGRQGVAVLKVTPELAEEIAFAYTAGTVWLASNPYLTDEEAAETEGVTAERFMEKYGVLAKATTDAQGGAASEP